MEDQKTEEQIFIQFFPTVSQFKEMAESDPLKAAQHLDDEIRIFEAWMLGRGLDPLTRYEAQILREYLAFKLVSKDSSGGG